MGENSKMNKQIVILNPDETNKDVREDFSKKLYLWNSDGIQTVSAKTSISIGGGQHVFTVYRPVDKTKKNRSLLQTASPNKIQSLIKSKRTNTKKVPEASPIKIVETFSLRPGNSEAEATSEVVVKEEKIDDDEVPINERGEQCTEQVYVKQEPDLTIEADEIMTQPDVIARHFDSSHSEINYSDMTVKEENTINWSDHLEVSVTVDQVDDFSLENDYLNNDTGNENDTTDKTKEFDELFIVEEEEEVGTIDIDQFIQENEEIALEDNVKKMDEDKVEISKQEAPSKYIYENIYTCRLCKFTGTESEIALHYDETKHKIRKSSSSKYSLSHDQIIECTKCNMKFQCIPYMEHFIMHGFKANECFVCGRMSVDKYQLVNHIQWHVVKNYISMVKLTKEYDDAKNMSCSLCGDTVSYGQLFAHWEQHITLDKEHSVPVKYENVKLSYLVENLKAAKILKEDMYCALCDDKRFERLNVFKVHLVEHLTALAVTEAQDKVSSWDNEDTVFRCQMCLFISKEIRKFKAHLRLHGSLTMYQCDICEKSFSDSSNFSKHKKVHNINVLFCDYCGKKFTLKNMLIDHIKKHMTLKLLPCPCCQKLFTMKNSLEMHIARVHKNGSRTRCGILNCSEVFSSNKEKLDHEWEVHKRRTIIIDCQSCGQKFRKFSDMKKHMKNEHRQPVPSKNYLNMVKLRKR